MHPSTRDYGINNPFYFQYFILKTPILNIYSRNTQIETMTEYDVIGRLIFFFYIKNDISLKFGTLNREI